MGVKFRLGSHSFCRKCRYMYVCAPCTIGIESEVNGGGESGRLDTLIHWKFPEGNCSFRLGRLCKSRTCDHLIKSHNIKLNFNWKVLCSVPSAPLRGTIPRTGQLGDSSLSKAKVFSMTFPWVSTRANLIRSRAERETVK